MHRLNELYKDSPENARIFYYRDKFNAELNCSEGLATLTDVCMKYLEGL